MLTKPDAATSEHERHTSLTVLLGAAITELLLCAAQRGRHSQVGGVPAAGNARSTYVSPARSYEFEVFMLCWSHVLVVCAGCSLSLYLYAPQQCTHAIRTLVCTGQPCARVYHAPARRPDDSVGSSPGRYFHRCAGRLLSDPAVRMVELQRGRWLQSSCGWGAQGPNGAVYDGGGASSFAVGSRRNINQESCGYPSMRCGPETSAARRSPSVRVSRLRGGRGQGVASGCT